jgi:hypothetical protein
MVESEVNAVEEGAGYETREEAVGAVGSTLADGIFIDTDAFLFFEVRDEYGELVEQLRLERIDGRWLVAETKTCFTG